MLLWLASKAFNSLRQKLMVLVSLNSSLAVSPDKSRELGTSGGCGRGQHQASEGQYGHIVRAY